MPYYVLLTANLREHALGVLALALGRRVGAGRHPLVRVRVRVRVRVSRHPLVRVRVRVGVRVRVSRHPHETIRSKEESSRCNTCSVSQAVHLPRRLRLGTKERLLRSRTPPRHKGTWATYLLGSP